MGAPAGEPGRNHSEGPVHEVEITRPFYLGAHEVTQAQYQKVMGTNPSHFAPAGAGQDQVRGQNTADFPAENMTWEEAADFCRRLSALPEERRAGRVYRLPTEAEWEYACRAGSTTAYHVGATLGPAAANFGRRPQPEKVGSFKPNAWGLFDMHGNVWEYCADHYQAGYYANSPRRDPRGPA
jgi:formylglycine-generating enzyme required for sulfatase activity